MDRYRIERGRRRGVWAGRSTAARVTLIAILLLLLIGARSIASYTIDFQWWSEMGQLNTWLSLLSYSVAPMIAATLLAFAILWLAHARARPA